MIAPAAVGCKRALAGAPSPPGLDCLEHFVQSRQQMFHVFEASLVEMNFARWTAAEDVADSETARDLQVLNGWAYFSH